jgi:hypothetical protein
VLWFAGIGAKSGGTSKRVRWGDAQCKEKEENASVVFELVRWVLRGSRLLDLRDRWNVGRCHVLLPKQAYPMQGNREGMEGHDNAYRMGYY